MGMSEWLEVRIPISPRADYFNRVHLIAHSIRSLGGRYADVRIRVTVGADQEPEDLYARLPWSREVGIDWVWVDRQEFLNWKATQHEYIATMMERFRPPFNSHKVLMLDADILAIRNFDELIDLIDARPGVAAVMAHISPFESREGLRRFTGWLPFGPGKALDHAGWWKLLFESTGTPMPRFAYQHSSWGITEHNKRRRYAPPYFNTGVVLATSDELSRFYQPYTQALDAVRAKIDTYFFEQIAMTLALFRTGVPFHVIPLRYNFPNQAEFDRALPSELAETRFLHFLLSLIHI